MNSRRWRGVAVTLVLLWLAASVFVAPEYALRAPDNPVTTTPAAVALEYADITIPSGELQLPGWWIPHSNPRAVLVWAHGGGSNRHSTFFNSLGFYQALHQRGIAVLTFDQRNHGLAPRDTGQLTFGRRESLDVIAALDWLAANTPTDIPVVLMGVSMGGASAIHAIMAVAAPDALILTDALLVPVDVLARGAWIATGLPSALFLPMAWGAVWFENLAAGAEAPLALAERLTLPTLYLQSPDDPITRAVHARALAAKQPNITLLEAPAVDAGDACIDFKGRWGSHASAYLCHPDWTMRVIDQFLSDVLPPAGQ